MGAEFEKRGVLLATGAARDKSERRRQGPLAERAVIERGRAWALSAKAPYPSVRAIR